MHETAVVAKEQRIIKKRQSDGQSQHGKVKKVRSIDTSALSQRRKDTSETYVLCRRCKTALSKEKYHYVNLCAQGLLHPLTINIV